MNKFKHFLIVVPLVFLSTAVTYVLISGEFVGFGLLELPTSASTQAVIIDQLIQGHFLLIAFLFSVIVVPMLYTFIAFRRREGDDSDGAHIHGNTALEIGWTVIPLIFVAIFAVWGWQAYNDVLAASDDETTIYVQAFKWDWAFFYPELDDYYDENIYVPVGQPVKLVMQSRDVIHAFWVPEFRVKQDVMPYDTSNAALTFGSPSFDESQLEGNSQIQVLRFTPTEIGAYEVRCAEICGTNHWSMYATVNVLSQADYDAWLAEVQTAQGLNDQSVSAADNE